jgi:DNA-binding transcriptional MerR regulator
MTRGKAQKKTAQRGGTAAAASGRFYKIGDVCSMTDTQPYVLRFWESEFPQLAPKKSRAGQRIYEKKDIDLVQKIKTLLYEEEYTIAGARKKLEEEGFTAPPAQDTGGAAPEGSRVEASGGGGRASTTLSSIKKELREIKKLLDS